MCNFLSMIDNWVGMEDYADKTWAAAKQRAYKDDSTTVGAIKKYAKQAKEDWEDESFSSIIKRFNPCNWTKITTNAMRCLMNGLELDIAYKSIIKQTILSGGNELEQNLDVKRFVLHSLVFQARWV